MKRSARSNFSTRADCREKLQTVRHRRSRPDSTSWERRAIASGNTRPSFEFMRLHLLRAEHRDLRTKFEEAFPAVKKAWDDARTVREYEQAHPALFYSASTGWTQNGI